jgi:hypothetical protein
MTGRERILAVLNRTSADRIPVDVGATEMTGISPLAYGRLKAQLGISSGHTRISDPIAGTVRIEKTIREKLAVDAVGLFIEPRKWRPDTLDDGSECLVPEKWKSTSDGGSKVFRHAVADIVCNKAAGSSTFEYSSSPLGDCDSPDEVAKKLQSIAFFDWPYHADEIAAEFGCRARAKREEIDGAVIMNVRARIVGGAAILRGKDKFLADLAGNTPLADSVLSRLTDACIARLTDLLPEVAGSADAICLSEGPCEGLTAALYKRHVQRHHERIFSFIKNTTSLPLIVGVRGLKPDVSAAMAGLGLDCLQIHASDGPSALKKFRKVGPTDVPIWGTPLGTDVLAKSTAKDLRAKIRRAVESAGPGFVFSFGESLPPTTEAGLLTDALGIVREMASS